MSGHKGMSGDWRVELEDGSLLTGEAARQNLESRGLLDEYIGEDVQFQPITNADRFPDETDYEYAAPRWLWDDFAKSAIAGLVRRPGRCSHSVARESFDIADAMMLERKKRLDGNN